MTYKDQKKKTPSWVWEDSEHKNVLPLIIYPQLSNETNPDAFFQSESCYDVAMLVVKFSPLWDVAVFVSLAALFFFFFFAKFTELPKREGTRNGCPGLGSSNSSPQPNLFFFLPSVGKALYTAVCVRALCG